MSDSLARAQLARAATRLGTRARSSLPALVLMTDDARLPDPLVAARALPRGSMVVVRTKDRAKLGSLSGALLKLARTHRFGVVVAGDPELASRLGADWFHLPETRAGEAARPSGPDPARRILNRRQGTRRRREASEAAQRGPCM